GGTVVAMKGFGDKPLPPPVPVPVVTTPDPTPVVDAGAVAAVVPQPPPDPSPEVDAGVEAPVDAGAPVKATPQRAVTLTTAMVQKGISQQKARFQKCFKDNKAELPSAQGTLKVQFAIASSGKVSSATTDLAGTKVSGCIEKAVKGIVFPRHVDLEVRVPIALSWDVR
ncbi:MAG TPA: AgmX/PglI C-terminal domain-containing protein, partial [Archangium sp.]